MLPDRVYMQSVEFIVILVDCNQSGYVNDLSLGNVLIFVVFIHS